MGNMNYTAEITHIPLFGAEVCPGLFISPAFSHLFPLLSTDLNQIAYQYRSATKDSKPLEELKDVEMHHLPEKLQFELKSLASGLHALLQCIDVREDVYFIGNTSRLVATELDVYPPARARRKTVQNRASLVLIDRSLDLATCVTHQLDTLLDKLLNTLPALPGHQTDRLVDVHSLTNVICTNQFARVILPGSLSPTSCSSQPTHLLPLVHKKLKEAILDVNRKLVEAASAEKLPINLSGRPGRVTADQLESTASLFKGKYPLIMKHLDLLQVSMATSQALKHPSSSKNDTAVLIEKNLTQTIADYVDDTTPSAIALLSKLILKEMTKPANERNLTLDDVLCLITYMYAVSDGECGDEEEEKTLREQFVKWILDDTDNLPPLVRQIVGDTVNSSILADLIERLWEKLDAVATARSDLQQFRSVLDPGDDMTPTSVKSLARQILEKIVDPSKPDLSDIECKSGGLKDLLKSGFGFFKGSGKPRPGDTPLLLLFFIGGVTAGEVKQIKEVVDKAKPQFEVLVGATRLSNKDTTLESLFVADNINFNS
ncbi:sec1 family domain-containing protein 2-like isoform X2 [Physella acuta]|nr:sec1 family domain-containing protein 2-like isoform X2 [Physella acuta]